VKVGITGAAGFLGTHLQLAIKAYRPEWDISTITRRETSSDLLLDDALAGVDVVFHLAGVNRAADDQVEQGNVELARLLSNSLDRIRSTADIVYANSIQADLDNPYGRGKAAAAAVLRKSAAGRGGRFFDVRFPNLFGEGGRPYYNSFVATFVAKVVAGEDPVVENDRTIRLVHAQDAAEHLIGLLGDSPEVHPLEGFDVRISDVAEILAAQYAVYRYGVFPDLSSAFEMRLFNTLSAALFPDHLPIPLAQHSDSRGTFVEITRSLGGASQSSFSTTKPGIRRGDHFHLRKAERFVVVKGNGLMRLRHMVTDRVVEYPVTGDNPVVVDMPTGWTHSIENIGEEEMITLFWISEPYDPTDPDTFPAKVSDEPVRMREMDGSSQ
jgi:UDP-2-acetamido-2,6-beta-L-arabino-hexul-4-ose reductase